MTDAKIPSRIVHFHQLKSFRTNTVLMFATLVVLLAAATTIANAQTFTVLYNFDSTHGALPSGSLTQGRDGNLYGTTGSGGRNNVGVVFKITPKGALSLISQFDGIHGATPILFSGLTLGTDTNFYGTTYYGGAYGYGTIFKIMPGGAMITLYSFTGSTDLEGDGGLPVGAPIQGSDGNLYGTSDNGVYKITPSGVFTKVGPPLHYGGYLQPLIQGTDGNLYGTYPNTVFKMTTKGVLSNVYMFDSPLDVQLNPLIQGSNGSLYGTSFGTSGWTNALYKLTLQGTYTMLHSSNRSPGEGLVEANDGNFYGVSGTDSGFGAATFFRVTPTDDYSAVYNVDCCFRPDFPLMQHTNGKFYGVSDDGTSPLGFVYNLDLGLPAFVRLVSTTGKVGTPIKILGQGFTGTTGVFVNGTSAPFKVWSDTFLKATVPSGATTGSVTVTTPTGTLKSNHEFRVRPVILSVAPASGAAGTTVVIAGTSFTQATKVRFSGGATAATFTVDSDTQVTAIVPAGAATGYVVLTTAGGRSRSPDTFTVTP